MNTVCMVLADENGMLQLSDGKEIGSRANLTCNSGYQPEGSFTSVVCTTGGWSNEIAKCSRKFNIVKSNNRSVCLVYSVSMMVYNC